MHVVKLDFFNCMVKFTVLRFELYSQKVILNNKSLKMIKGLHLYFVFITFDPISSKICQMRKTLLKEKTIFSIKNPMIKV